jgi:GNAT superfamily N-acetyltransferase
MNLNYSFVSRLPDPAAFEGFLRDYYTLMAKMLASAGGPALSPADLASDTLENIDELLPPNGRTLLVTDDDGALVGCGVIKMVRSDAAELKRLFIRPQARGSGLGRRLFEMRVEEARRMGCRTIYADTVRGNTAMLNMYEKFGFAYIPRYPENANAPELEPFQVASNIDFPGLADTARPGSENSRVFEATCCRAEPAY